MARMKYRHRCVLAGCGLFAIGTAAAQTVHSHSLWSADSTQLIAIIPNADPQAEPSDPTSPPVAATRGATWAQMSCPADAYIKAVSMASPQVGFAAAELGRVLRTVDGGDTWQYVLNQGFPYYYYGIQAFDEDTVVITGFNNQTGRGILRWTDDGGASWDPVVELDGPTTVLDWLYQTRFADRDRGVIQAQTAGVWYTTTGGRTAADWNFVQPINTWWSGSFTFLADGRVWLSGHDNFRSLDGGASWTPIADADPVFDGPNGMLPDGRGLIGGGSISPTVAGWLYSTEDGGDSWTPSPILTTPYPIRGIHWLNGERAWVVGGNFYSNPQVGGIWGTQDGGATWTLEQDTGAEILDVTSVQVSGTEYDVYAVGQVGQIWRATVTVGLPGDLDGDGDVDVTDLGMLLADFGCTGGGCSGDVNGDGNTDIADLGLLLANYGA